MRCEKCGNYSSRSDSYCRRCGAEMRNTRLPVKRPPASPTVWSQAAPVLARGAALVALGVAAEVALNALAKGALRLPTMRRPAKTKAIATRRNGELPAGSVAVSETVVMRRLIFRR
ncbi:MAG: hypothetical protein IH920_06235 [Chloroflexi bacterium]|nr:hypothetical protein [Chloroflexota bacterium]